MRCGDERGEEQEDDRTNPTYDQVGSRAVKAELGVESHHRHHQAGQSKNGKQNPGCDDQRQRRAFRGYQSFGLTDDFRIDRLVRHDFVLRD